ncbi:MAG: hypothetical protein GVY21_05255 [Gammaproteobacteria bacterium]|jgi:hypothetical protein|nr:hypothetical protein [Gammaproteobacteria bacterium]
MSTLSRRTWLKATFAALTAAGVPTSRAGTSDPETMRTRLIEDFVGWDAIENHRTGSDGDDATARWLLEGLRRAGVDGRLDGFEFDRRLPGDCYVGTDEVRVPGEPLFDAPGTSGAGIAGVLSESAEPGGILLTSFEPFGGHPDTQALERARRDSACAGIVAVAGGKTVKPGLALLNADSYANPFGPPVLQVATEHADALRALARSRRRVTVQAPLTHTAEAVYNVEGRIPGRRPELPPLVIMTPRSAWWTCTAERGGGISTWLEAARALVRSAPERDVLFTANTGHELGHVGLQYFLTSRPELMEGAHAWVHLGANFAAAGGKVIYQASDADLLEAGLAAMARGGVGAPQTMPVGDRPLGEAREIFDAGGRFVSLLGSNPLFHHPDDRWPDAVDLDKTERLSQAMLDVISGLAGA